MPVSVAALSTTWLCGMCCVCERNGSPQPCKSATMTSAPKKKRDFFNGSQGLNFRDFKSPEPQEARGEAMTHEGAYALDERRASGSNPLTPPVDVGFPSTQDQGGHPSAGYSFPAPCPDRQSPAGYHRCHPISPGFHFQSRAVEFDDSAPLAEAPAPYPSISETERSPWTGPSMHAQPVSEGDGEGDDGKKKTKKRKQRCRMCANHGIYVEIKGHKWYCPYKNLQHSCAKCEITRKRQYFMAEQQKLTREQQQQQHLHFQREMDGEAETEKSGQSAMPVRLPAKPSDFPRMQELLEETDHILDEDLFRQIDECVRPKVTHH